MPKRPLLAILLFLTGNLAAQAAGSRNELDRMILHGEFAAARTRLATIAGALDETERALYEAAVQRAPKRAVAMLTVARLYPRSEVADRALVAAAGAILLGTPRHGFVRRLDEREPGAREQWEKEGGVGERLRALGEILRGREPVDFESCAAARRLWQLARTRLDKPPIRIRAGERIPVPAPLAEAVTVRFYRRSDGGQLDAFARKPNPKALREHDIEAKRYGVTLDPLPAGEYVVELETVADSSRILRPLLVSDLDVLVQRVENAVIVFAEIHGDPAAGAGVSLGGQSARTDAHGIATLHLPHGHRAVVRAVLGAHVATADVYGVGRDRPSDTPRCHVAVDRPLYRRGQVVRGRVVLREPGLVEIEGIVDTTGTGAKPGPSPNTPITLEVWRGSDRPVRIAAKTDDHGVLPFEFRIPDGAPFGFARIRISRPAETRPQALFEHAMFEVAAYKRSTVTATLTGPHEIAAGTEQIVFRLAAHYASGAPASGLRIRLHARLDQHGTRQVAWLDDAGQLAIPIAVERLYYDGSLDAGVCAPDGTMVHCERGFRRRAPPTIDNEDLRVAAVGTAFAGRSLRVRVNGPKGTRALVTVARGAPLATQSVGFDATGAAELVFELPRAAWPSVDVFVSTQHDRTERRIETRPAEGLFRVDASTGKATHRPGEEVVLTIRTHDADGLACRADVMVAVVDERMFVLAEDRTPDLRASLAPTLPSTLGRWTTRCGIHPEPPLRVLGKLLRGGRLDHVTRAFPGPSSPGEVAPPAPESPPRSDFQPTAFFAANLRTGAHGTVTARFRLPDTLTTYRITTLACGAGAGTATAIDRFVVEKDLAVTALVPRTLRCGDRVELPVVVDNHSKEMRGRVRLSDEANVLTVDSDGAAMALRRGVTESSFGLAAHSAGTARIQVSVAAGSAADASLRSVPILEDAIERPVVETLRIHGRVSLRPDAPVAGKPRHLVLLGGRGAVVADCERFLAEYPYGCVEQTLSRILPYFAVARSGGPSRTLSGPERKRMFAGLRRLRSLRAADSRFAWWPGRAPDDGMSALVIHGLVMAREGGLDLEAHGLRLDFTGGYVVDRARALLRDHGRTKAVESAELVAAALRFARSELLLDATRSVVYAGQRLPRGFLARAGLALAASGDRAAAATVLARLRRGEDVAQPATSWSRFPGEEPTVVAATHLELLLATDGPRGERDALVLTLLGGFVGGSFGSTLGTSTAIAALWKDAGPRPRVAGPQRVSVEVAGRKRTLRLSATNEYRAELDLQPGAVLFETGDDREVIAVVRATVREPGAKHAAWRAGLAVDRGLSDEILARGRPVTARLTVASGTPVRYVVVSCPIPAGFEVLTRDRGFDVFDDRIVTTIDRLAAHRPTTIRFEMIPSLSGRVAWPPATAEAMYAPVCSGGSCGARLAVARRVLPREHRPLRALFTGPETSPPGATGATGVTEAAEVPRNPENDAGMRQALEKKIDAWSDRLRTACTRNGILHATSAELTEPQRRLLAELDGLFEEITDMLDASARIERWRFDWWRFWIHMPEYGAAAGPLLRAARRRLEEFRARTAERLRPAAVTAIRAGDAGAVGNYLDLLVGSGADAARRTLALLAVASRAGHTRVLATILENDILRPPAVNPRGVNPRGVNPRGVNPRGGVSANGESSDDGSLDRLLVSLLSHADAGVRRAALGALPENAWASVPTAVLERAIDEDWDEYARVFLTHPLGGGRILALLRDTSFCRDYAICVEDHLSPELRKRAPLMFFRYAYTAEVTESTATNGELLRALHAAHDEDWQQNLLRLLVKRGVRRSPDPLFAAWLGASAGDRDAALELRRRIWADAEGVAPLLLDPAFVASAFSWDWTASEFLGFAVDADGDWVTPYVHAHCSRDPQWAVRVLDQIETMNWFSLADLPTPLTGDVREALVRLAGRDETWIKEIVETFERGAVDVEWLRARATTLPEGDIRSAFAAARVEIADVERAPSATVRRLVGIPTVE